MIATDFQLEQEMYGLVEDAVSLPEYDNILDFFDNGFELTANDVLKRFDIKYSPWIRELCRWFTDPVVQKMYLIQGSQTGKTSFQMGTLLYVSQYVHGNPRVLWVQSTDDEADKFVANRLKPFLDEAGREDTKGKRWKNSYFHVFNSQVKVAAGQSFASQKSDPCKYVIGDECGIWKTPLGYSWQRTRTFENENRKGIYATTPPFDAEHHSWLLAIAAAFYRWYVPCLNCETFQAMEFSNLKFRDAKSKSGKWDLEKIREITRYECPHCGDSWDESKKLEIITEGKPVCVDPKKDYQPAESIVKSSKTMQISAMYSFFTKWGTLAATFIEKKQEGPEGLKVFFTDELAEAPRTAGKSHKTEGLKLYRDETRKNGTKLWDCEFFTGGVDVQQRGELYCVLQGWRMGGSAHMMEYGVVNWKDNKGNPIWNELIDFFKDYLDHLSAICIDASDGVVWKDVRDFCDLEGFPYHPLKETPKQNVPVKKVTLKDSEIEVYEVNSHRVKDYIEAAFNRVPGHTKAWTFPRNTADVFFEHMSNEHKITEKRGGQNVKVWKPKYNGAPQHFFSAYVYSVCAMYLDRQYLIQKIEEKPEENQQLQKAAAKEEIETAQDKGVDWIRLNEQFWSKG